MGLWMMIKLCRKIFGQRTWMQTEFIVSWLPIWGFSLWGKCMKEKKKESYISRIFRLMWNINKILMYRCLTNCLQRPHISVSLDNGFSLKHVLKEPVYKEHFLCFPWVVAIDKFDCTCICMVWWFLLNSGWKYRR